MHAAPLALSPLHDSNLQLMSRPTNEASPDHTSLALPPPPLNSSSTYALYHITFYKTKPKHESLLNTSYVPGIILNVIRSFNPYDNNLMELFSFYKWTNGSTDRLSSPESQAESPGVRIQPGARAPTPNHYIIITHCFLLHPVYKALAGTIRASMPCSPSPKLHTS